MSNAKKPKHEPSKTSSKPSTITAIQNAFDPRNNLSMYIEHPEKNPDGRVLQWDDDFVVIQDKYPKSSVHLLLLPRNPNIYFQHPLQALSKNPDLLAEVQRRTEPLKKLAATELRRLYGRSSASDAPYQKALEELMSSPDAPTSHEERESLLPPGRDWLSEIKVGVHAHPSMNHMHMHILSRDMHSEFMKHKKHYLSFNTSFLVNLNEFPLDEGSERFHPGDWPSWNMKCWRCGKNFGNKFKALNAHLQEEFDAWRKE